MMSVNSRPSRSLYVLIVWGLVSITLVPARAEDTAVIQSPTQSTRVTIKGQIVDYTGQSLSIRTGPMAVLKTFPATEVVKVETEYSPAHAQKRTTQRNTTGNTNGRRGSGGAWREWAVYQ